MKHRAPAPSRLATSAPQGSAAPVMPSDVATLQEQLRLARAQNAYLHRKLATALKQGPLAPASFDSDIEAVRAENIDLRERLSLLARHFEDLQRRYEYLEWHCRYLDTRLGQSSDGPVQSSLVDEPVDLMSVLTRLLTVAHPDRWGRGQLASQLAHELTVAINAARAKLEGV
jgi:hypothetical protein